MKSISHERGDSLCDKKKRLMKKYLFLGDTHNDLDFAESAGKLARANAAEIVPPGFSAKGTSDYKRAQLLSMRRVDTLIKKYRPPLHVHGHWHTRATTYRRGSRVEALDCNQLDSAHLDDSTLLWSRGHDRARDALSTRVKTKTSNG